jgi:hypothetical protein
MTFRPQRFFGSFVTLSGLLAFLLPASSLAEPGTQISGGWRPTLRRSYVFLGNSDKQIELPDLVAGKSPESGQGVVTKETELARVELKISHEVINNGRVFLRFMGGRWSLRLSEADDVHVGQDLNFELGGTYETKLTELIRFDTVVGGRVRSWKFKGNQIPRNGNVGLMLGVTPKIGPVSLILENTLAAAWLYDLNDLGAQKDSSVLKIRPQFEMPLGNLGLQFAVEYYHTHTEFFGSKVIPKQNSIMLDDFELAAIVGATYSL